VKSEVPKELWFQFFVLLVLSGLCLEEWWSCWLARDVNGGSRGILEALRITHLCLM
jgi:hypothetical protein